MEVKFLEELNRQQQIRQKGFDITRPTDYGKIKVGTKTLEDATLQLGAIQTQTKNLISKATIYRALADNDMEKLREISNYFYKTSGIYARACNYLATLYRYDWYIVPEVYDEKMKEEKIVTEFNKILNYLDNSSIKKLCGEIALGVIKNGAYYGYLVDSKDGIMIQELPVAFCRSRFSVGGFPTVEFNMRFFDKAFLDTNYRLKVLNLFPDEFKKGYMAYKSGKLSADSRTGLQDPTQTTLSSRWTQDTGWYMLDPEKTIKFSFNSGSDICDIPLLINAIPELLDLDAAQDLDRRKQLQKLLKIIVQKLPMDKNGDLIFDIDEARDIHNNAVQMLKRAVGVDVLTTFAEIDSIDMSDKNTTTTQDDLKKVERSVFNALGISQNLFNTDGNMSLTMSILNDESAMRSLLFQFTSFFDRIVQSQCSNKKKCNFRLYMLETTQYNYKDISKMYKEQVQLGYSKMLPQIALGHSQSSILNTAFFENQVLHLSEVMIPPLMSSTMNLEDLKNNSGSNKNNPENTDKSGKTSNPKNQQTMKDTSEKKAGRPETPDEKKSEKTIQNKESMS